MDIMEQIEVIKLYKINIKRSQSFLYNVLEKTETWETLEELNSL